MELRRRIIVNKDGLAPNSAPNGVYIQHANRQLYPREKWNTKWNSDANGVAVITDNCKFVISDRASQPRVWGGMGVVVSGMISMAVLSLALKDYLGPANTAAIIARHGNDINGNAAAFCNAVLFNHGKTGYLGSIGEWQEVYIRCEEIDKCMLLIDAEPFGMIQHWTSTQAGADSAWIRGLAVPDARYYDKNVNFMVRPFAPL